MMANSVRSLALSVEGREFGFRERQPLIYM
jgi:hypothetical protein